MSDLIEHTSRLWERRSDAGSLYQFFCPACGYGHFIPVGQSGFAPHLWTFNANYEKPTFTPSLKMDGIGCHLSLTDGMIHYDKDCRHEMRGKTVPMADL